MQKKLLRKLNWYLKQNSRRRVRQRLLGTMACIVVFCTTYALILPAITLEKQCTIEEHTHSESCYVQLTETQTRSIRCTAIAEDTVLLHTHGDLCRDETGALICPLEELEAHTHGDECFTIPEDHTHGDECYTLTSVLSCGQEVTAGHSHTDDCYIQETGIACGLEETEDHSHSEDCNGPVSKLNCGLEETPAHDHTEQCYSETKTLNCQARTLSCPKEAYTEHTHADSCYLEGTLVCELQQVIPHSHTEACVQEETVELDTETLTCLLEEGESHTHGTLCYGTWELLCEKTEHTHTTACEPSSDLTDAQIIQIDEVIALINALPDAETVDATLTQFRDSGDTEGETVWLQSLKTQVAEANGAYTALGEMLQPFVSGVEKLEALAYLLEEDVSGEEIPCGLAEHDHTETCYDSDGNLTCGLEAHTHSADCYGQFEDPLVRDMVERILALPSAEEIEKTLAHFQESGDTEGEEAYYEDVSAQVITCYRYYKELSPSQQEQVPNRDKLLTLEFIWSASQYVIAGGVYSDDVYTVQSASTAEFVTLNLYDYHGTKRSTGYTDINSRFNTNKEYPGFQWNGGAYPQRYRVDGSNMTYGWIANRNSVDCIDFGNSLITDYALTASPYVPDSGSPVSSSSVWYNGNTTAGRISVAKADGSNGLINAIVFGDSVGRTDRPIGITSSFGNAIDLITNSENWPDLKNAASTNYGTSLRYLFDVTHPGNYADQRNAKSIDGLFQYDPVTGAYYYDSRENHAYFDDANDRFILYEQVITPNFILYPFGNFMPFNGIADRNKATQVSAFNHEGGVQAYLQTILNRMDGDTNKDYSEIQLIRMLYSYRNSWENWTDSEESHGRKWNTITAADAINDYFNHSSEFSSEGWDFNSNQTTSSGRTMSQLLNKLYNIDFDVEKNFFFGMDMKMNFFQPLNGMTGMDNNGDGYSDYPMEFYFAGDDDVWVFIDDVLFLDLTGIHRHVGGKIDFVNGKVYYYDMDSYVDGAVSTTPFATQTFADILTAAGKDPAKYLKKNAGNQYTTFLDYSSHTFHFYYTERGSGSSVCRINFNFPLLKKNAITVTKENVPEPETGVDGNVTILGNPDYYFNIIAERNPDELVVGPTSVTGITTYEVRDSAGKFLRNGTVDNNGIFTLKAGETAVFNGIPESLGKYYVQELIREDNLPQYNNVVKVNGTNSRYNGTIYWLQRAWAEDLQYNSSTTDPDGVYALDGYKWTGHSGPESDTTANGTFFFEARNGVYASKLAKLSITKELTPHNDVTGAVGFKINVALDGKPLPAGTTYTVGSETRTVGFDAGGNSYVEIKARETAVISGILSGTQFRVWESEASAEGHDVTYSNTSASGNGENITIGTDGVTGTIRVSDLVSIKVTNARQDREFAISVVKALTSTTSVEMVGDPEFSFQIMKGDANGNRTDAAFYGNGVSYNVYDAATNEPLREDQKTEQYGMFKLKAGEKAVFDGIPETAGNYYIREVIPIDSFVAQYDTCYVDGAQAAVVDIPGFSTHKGVVSTVKNPYNGDTVFTFHNRVKTEKLSYLTITKNVVGVSDAVEKSLEFDMMVELNGVLQSADGWTPIPVGTPYTLYDTDAFIASSGTNKVKIENHPDRVVTTAGIVTVPGGATAEIDYMIPGTTYRVYETSGSAEGYTVGYGEFWGQGWITAYEDRVEGTIPVYNESNLATAHVCMTVTNTLPATNVEFSVYKQMVNGNLDPDVHTVNFTAECISAKAKDGSTVDALLGTGSNARVTIGDNEWHEANFVIGYDYYQQFQGHVATSNWPVRLIYEITEVPSDDLEFTHDATKYYAVVDVNLTNVNSSWRFTASLVTPVPVYADNTVPESGFATFRNTLVEDLTLEKQVVGGTASQESGSFDFTVQIGTDGTTPLGNWNIHVLKNGQSAGTLTTDSTGSITLEDIKHGDKVQLKGIPLGCVWKITETNTEGYLVSWTANEASGDSNIAAGDISSGGMEVVFINTLTYTLPQTGGAGTTSYTVVGLMLTALSVACLMYIPSKRGREVF